MHLEKLGVEIEKLTKEQSQYIGVSKKGPFKSRVGILVISNLLEESLNYSISIPVLLSNQEILLLIFSISIGILACVIPAVNVYNMNISKTLSDE